MEQNLQAEHRFEIIDAHVHVWDIEKQSCPWQPIGGHIPDFSGSPEKLLAAMASADVQRAVVVAATPYGWDNSFVVETLNRFPDRLAGVCLINALAPHVQDTVRHWTLQGCHGVRLLLTDVEPWVPQPKEPQDLYPLWEIADALDIPICVLMEADSVPLIAQVLTQFPHVQVLFDDASRLALKGPEGLESLAEFDQCHAKLSGFWWHSAQGHPYADMLGPIQRIVESFGARRVLWGGDWPWVEKQGHRYHNVLDALLGLAFLTQDDKSRIVSENANELWFRHGAAAPASDEGRSI